jgi:hypothetical protein
MATKMLEGFLSFFVASRGLLGGLVNHIINNKAYRKKLPGSPKKAKKTF